MYETELNGNGNNHCPNFNFNKVCKGSNIIICGKRLTGKSHLLIDFLQHRKSQFPSSKQVIFASKYITPIYNQYFSSDTIYDKYNKYILYNLITQQETDNKEELIIVFDDIASHKADLMEDPDIKNIVRYGSSLKITLIFCVQYIGQMDEIFKRNVDYIFCFHENNLKDQKLLFDEFNDILNFSHFTEFKNIYDSCVSKSYRCLVIDFRSNNKSIFWYKSNEFLETLPPSYTSKKKSLLKYIKTYIIMCIQNLYSIF